MSKFEWIHDFPKLKFKPCLSSNLNPLPKRSSLLTTIRVNLCAVLPSQFLGLPVRLVLSGESDALSFDRGLADAVVFDLQVGPEAKVVLPGQGSRQNLRQALAQVQRRHGHLFKVLSDLEISEKQTKISFMLKQ